ncbi:uncharacterized protein LOC130825427 [Amaranthus tricolor]|uniref:uncharacterized protein LOC130825427 n=1 Tax=Amaranthus tricolor TaxID=29722 RepID=UPI00258826ED|nr:uncharacterized protein LOC130825427 [Amaranthus tricolor]
MVEPTKCWHRLPLENSLRLIQPRLATCSTHPPLTPAPLIPLAFRWHQNNRPQAGRQLSTEAPEKGLTPHRRQRQATQLKQQPSRMQSLARSIMVLYDIPKETRPLRNGEVRELKDKIAAYLANFCP